MNPSNTRWRSRSVVTLAWATAVLATSVSVTGCRKPPGITKDDNIQTEQQGEPWEVAAKRLRKDTDVVTCKAVLTSLNNDPTATATGPLMPLAPDREATLTARVPLSAEDREEIRGATFTAFDPVYLTESLYLRDVARSLVVPGISPDRLADLAFAWDCRQVHLAPWLIEVQPGVQMGTALPPMYVLRRGAGSGLERMYVLLAIFQQLGLDGCLIGPPEAKDRAAAYVALSADKKTVFTGSPRGPFWAVGVRVATPLKLFGITVGNTNQIRMYDPWRGTCFPATLSQMKANPEAYKEWFADPANVSGVTVEEMKTATPYLAVPVNALSPRMATLQEKLKGEVDVQLAIDPVKLQERFPEPKPQFWNPPEDEFSFGRTTRKFLPVEQGGADKTPQSPQRTYEAYLRAQLPTDSLVIAPELLRYREAIQDITSRITQFARGAFATTFLTAPTPLERLQRGQYQDAARVLVDKQDTFARGLERLRNNRDADQELRRWAETATQLYTDLGRTGLIPDREARAAALAQIQAQIDSHWRSQTAAQLLVDRAVSEVGQAEATFLLALCQHELAEQAQARYENATGPEAERYKQEAINAWSTALGEWRTYEGLAAPQSRVPARVKRAKELTARAELLSKQK